MPEGDWACPECLQELEELDRDEDEQEESAMPHKRRKQSHEVVSSEVLYYNIGTTYCLSALFIAVNDFASDHETKSEQKTNQAQGLR